MARGLWEGTRAALHENAYWAETVPAYFDANDLRVQGVSPPVRVTTREELAAYDQELGI